MPTSRRQSGISNLDHPCDCHGRYVPSDNQAKQQETPVCSGVSLLSGITSVIYPVMLGTAKGAPMFLIVVLVIIILVVCRRELPPHLAGRVGY